MNRWEIFFIGSVTGLTIAALLTREGDWWFRVLSVFNFLLLLKSVYDAGKAGMTKKDEHLKGGDAGER